MNDYIIFCIAKVAHSQEKRQYNIVRPFIFFLNHGKIKHTIFIMYHDA